MSPAAVSWKAFGCALALAGLLAGGPAPVSADPAPLWSDDELARFAEVIALGTVTDVQTGVDPSVASI